MRLSILILVALCIAFGHSHDLLGGLLEGAGNVVQGITGTAQNVVHHVLDGGSHGLVCNRNVLQDYKKSQKAVYSALFKQVASHTDNHFVFSPYNIWLTLAALAEGSDPSVKDALLKYLFLPQEVCLRTKYYYTALNVEQSGRDVTFNNNRQILLDQSLTVNPSWRDLMRSVGLIDVDFGAVKANGQSGNSIALDYFEYQGLWTTAFPSASIHREPFYDEQGSRIGEVNMMRIKQQARLAHLPFMDSKALELPVGIDGRYKMLITLGIGHHPIKNTIAIFMGAILHIFSLLKTSLVPIEIAIPQFAMTSEFDVRPILEEIGIDAFFSDPAATNFVSHPPALPAALIQHATVTVGPDGVSPLPTQQITNPIAGIFQAASNIGTGLAAAVGNDFIANKPFLFGLFDTKTDTCLFAGAYARPSTL